jgi:HD-GYP domain-containing protein (c-di-GMP phosphodiesterase class II)
MKRKIGVEELVLGMYVSELDRPWTDTPFMFQGFVLDSEDQINELRKFCRFVYVDAERSQLTDNRLTAAPRPQSAAAPAVEHKPAVLQGIRKVEYAPSVSVETELPRAKEVYAYTTEVLEDVSKAIVNRGTVDAGAVKGAVNKMTESVIRNPDAAVLFSALKERGGYLLTRSMNASIYMIMFARFLGMEQADIELAGLVGMLQDIAMVQVPRSAIEKKGPLTPEEIELVRSHVALGAEILKATHGLPPEVARLAALHHERYDGSGYPKGLRGEEIGTIGGCAGIVDTYGAMTTERSYAAPMSPSNALGMLHKWRSKTFHPDLVEEFIRCIGAFPVGSVIELNSGEVGIVISQNQEKRLQPRVVVVRDAKGAPLRPQVMLDLARGPKMNATEIYRIRRTLEYGRSGGVGIKDILS